MGFKTREEYYADLRAMRPNVFKNGKFIEDLVTDPATAKLVENEAYTYDLLQDSKNDEMLKAKSTLSGDTIVRWHTLMNSAEDLMANAKMKRFLFNKIGTCQAGTCVGWNCFNVLWSVTYDIDKDKGTDYHKRIENWLRSIEHKDLKIAGALTDAKGDRSKSAGQQANKDASVHVTEVRPDGIVVNGTKTMIAHAAVCHEIIAVPGTGYKEADKEYAVAFAVPRDIEGLTIVQTNIGEGADGWDDMKYGDQSSYLIFEDCFIPNERVFMCGEYEHSGNAINRFVGNYRAGIGACMGGQGDVMVGASILMARVNGLPMKTFKDKLIDMELINEQAYAIGLGAMLAGSAHPSGVWFANPKMACSNKCFVGKNYAEIRRICQDIGGGIAENGCLPSYQDCTDPVIGPKVMKAIQGSADYTAETRARAARLSEWLVRGGGLLAFIHGGGSPDGAKLVVRANTPFEYFVKCAADIAGITEEVKDPAGK